MEEHIGTNLGNYRLVRLLGYGGFADVYLGEHIYLEVNAAIKVIHFRVNHDDRANFLQEARLIAHLRHPHIVRVLDFGITGDTPYLVMEYAPQGTLRNRHPKGSRIPIETIVSYVKQIAEALQYAHQQHVTHRDIKPENMLLGLNDEVLLSDFGLAITQSSTASLASQNQAGTAPYMAPEQIMGKAGPASDQYALGVIVYEWLTGELPFQGTNPFQIWTQHLYHQPPRLREKLPLLSPAIEDAIFGALAKDPQRRFVSIQEFADVFEDACQSTESLDRISLSPSSRIRPPKTNSPLPPVRQPAAFQAEISSQQTRPLQLVAIHAARAPITEERTEPLVGPLVEPSAEPLAVPFSIRPTTRAIERHTHPSLEHTNRQRLLTRVYNFWIRGVLEHSLNGTGPIIPELREHVNAVANPWELVLREPGVSTRLAPGTRISQVYDESGGELLILGAPGSGKTTLLLELARELLQRAQKDDGHALPIVFNLSSWTLKRPPLLEWFIEELNNKYQVPRALGSRWINADQVLPLLDGLDEVAPAYRTACIEAINSFRQEHGLVSIVVCSRITDYLAQSTRVILQRAVIIQALQAQQINNYLASGGDQLAALRVALQSDPALREMAATPLMLNILAMAYRGVSMQGLLETTSFEARRRQIFEQYVQRVLERRGTRARYHPAQTTQWLAWLAHQLVRRNQTQFYLERMQPDWLPNHFTSWLYHFLALVPIYGAVGLLLGWLIGGLALFHIGLIAWGFIGLLIGILLSVGTTHSASTQPSTWSIHNLFTMPHIRNGIGIGLAIGLLVGFLNDFTLAGNFTAIERGIDIVIGGLAGALIGITGSALLGTRTADIQPAELVTWSWHDFIKLDNVRKGYGIGLVVGIINVIIYAQVSNVLSALLYGLIYCLLGTLLGTLLFGLFGGLRSKVLDASSHIRPNEGIRRSAHNSRIVGVTTGLIYGVASGICFALVNGLLYGWDSSPLGSLLTGMIYGLACGLLSSLLFGGDAYIKHAILRLLLWCSRAIPWNYARFLDYASEQILLYKVGGGYIFVHRLLLEHFASLYKSSPSASSHRHP